MAQHNVDRAQNALELAEGRVRAMASGNASVGAASGFLRGNTASVAESVERIVKTVSLVAQNGEFCDALIRDYVHTPAEFVDRTYGPGSPALKFIDVCSDVVKNTRQQLAMPVLSCADGGCRLLTGKLNFPISKELADQLNAPVPTPASPSVSQPKAVEDGRPTRKDQGR